MKSIHPFKLGIVILAIGIFGVLVTGCSTPNGGSSIADCDNWQRVVAAYDVRMQVGPPPSEDEARIAAAARALLVAYCGDPGSVVKDLRFDGAYRQPEDYSYAGRNYKRVLPITMVFLGGGWWQTPPVYRMTRTSTLWVPCDKWVIKQQQDPEFKEVKHE